ncbi:hypothetical protein LQ948_18730 [Jiella sp. MQZ9-1]|uniref:DUF600 family protein n=1 Tax=Jiella flava TaxID=2816857 RepID=A0A939FZY1_9HYPH|nr:hypothetical protein [Jiella flava]MBO0664587.1 hypothetical protein [Jiella flava]MCD2473225.1 hypothetical protein [Jiella flava]
MSNETEYTAGVVREIIASGELDGFNWSEFSLVVGYDKDGDVDQTYGYAYASDGAWRAFAVTPRLVRPSLNRYRERLRQEGDTGIIKLLFQFNRDTGRFNSDFEYENAARWQVTPANIDTIVQDLQPNLGSSAP